MDACLLDGTPGWDQKIYLMMTRQWRQDEVTFQQRDDNHVIKETLVGQLHIRWIHKSLP
jgi:hypothetical protein